MDGVEAAQLAARWRSEFAEDVEWHLQRKIEQLAAWGDTDGAEMLERVLALIHAEWAQLSLRTKLA